MVAAFQPQDQQHPEMAALIAELNRLRAKVRTHEDFEHWQRKLDANTAVSAQHKLVLTRIRRGWEYLAQKQGIPAPVRGQEPELITMSLNILAEACGISRSTVSKTVADLIKMGAVRRHDITTRDDETGVPRTHAQLAPTRYALDHPDELAPEEPRNHGGKREWSMRLPVPDVCPTRGCGGRLFQTDMTLVCPKCGTLHAHDVDLVTVNEEGIAVRVASGKDNIRDALAAAEADEAAQEPAQDLAQQQQEERAAQDAEDALEPVQDATEASTKYPDPFDEGGPTYTDPFTSDDELDEDADDDDGEEREAW